MYKGVDIDEKIWDAFGDYCRKNKLKLKNELAIAIKDYLKKKK